MLIDSVYPISPVYTPLSVWWGGEGEGGVVGANGDSMRGTPRAQLGPRSGGLERLIYESLYSNKVVSIAEWAKGIPTAALVALDDLALSPPLLVAQDTVFQHIYIPSRSRPPL